MNYDPFEDTEEKDAGALPLLILFGLAIVVALLYKHPERAIHYGKILVAGAAVLLGVIILFLSVDFLAHCLGIMRIRFREHRSEWKDD